MNAKLRNSIKGLYGLLSKALLNFTSTIISIFRIMVLSKWSVARKEKCYGQLRVNEVCTVLANGPSLKKAFEKGEVRYKDCDVMCVNMFVLSDEFWNIKPRFYFIADGAYFEPQTERHNLLINQLSEALNKADWDIYLCVFRGGVNGGILAKINNPHIKVLRWNGTVTEGFTCFRNVVFDHCFGMPKCQTVAGLAIMSAVLMGYKKVNLYGVDHSWTKDLCVDDDNVVCYGDRHVYDTNLTVLKRDYSIAFLLRAYANMFEGHKYINEYAEARGCEIVNCTRGSFVDAYKRLKQ